jgi:PAS domain S-box-containing protein
MVSISSNCFKASIHYALFLRVVCQDYYNALEVYQSARGLIESMTVSKKVWEITEEKLGSNSSSAVVVISANINDVGTIKSVNHELHEMLGYDRKMLLNQNITTLMPQQFALSHSAAITKYFESNAAITKKERLVFALHILGYIVPCNILCKVIPTLENGIEIIGFITVATNIYELRAGEDKVSDEDVMIFMLDPSFNLLAFNKKLLIHCSIQLSNINIAKYHQSTQKISLAPHMPEVFVTEALAQQLTSCGFNSIINLQKLKQQLLSEIFDFFYRGDDYPVQSYASINSDLNYGKITSNGNIYLPESNLIDIQFNIKHKWYSLLNTQNAYMILTLAEGDGECTRKDASDPTSQKLLNAKNVFEEIQHRDQLNKCVNDNASVSQSSSSSK